VSTTNQRAYALAVTGLALGLVLWTTLSYPVNPAIALHWGNVDAPVAVLAGVGYWTLFGLLGALRVRQLEGGPVLTFHLPFVVAGTILGGPVVGGWMGLLSQFERRELADAPWYGVLGNHAIIAVAAITAGAAGEAVMLAARHAGADIATANFALALAVAGVFGAVNLLLVTPVVAMRRNVRLTDAFRLWDQFRTTLVAEGILAWLMALVYLSVGWWAPIACVALVLVIWEKGDLREEKQRDPMTGLLNELGFIPRLEIAVREARVRSHVHALLVIDLDGFGLLNKQFGMPVGDEVVVAVAGRLKSAVRDNDPVARFHRAGDEFAILLMNVRDETTAANLSRRIHARICQPIVLRSSDQTVSVGASIGVFILDRSAGSARHAIVQADLRMQHAKKQKLGVWDRDSTGVVVGGLDAEMRMAPQPVAPD
jgi:diguanylate cyclase (GGDEF)-like protein